MIKKRIYMLSEVFVYIENVAIVFSSLKIHEGILLYCSRTRYGILLATNSGHMSIQFSVTTFGRLVVLKVTPEQSSILCTDSSG